MFGLEVIIKEANQNRNHMVVCIFFEFLFTSLVLFNLLPCFLFMDNTDFISDRNVEEPCPLYALSSKTVIKQTELVDIWREKNGVKQYTWIRVTENKISAARLDRFYVKKTMCNRAVNTHIIPNVISDHHLVTLHISLSQTTP